MPKAKELNPKQREALLKKLEARFRAHPERHAGLEWAAVLARLTAKSAVLWSLNEMERSGGEPDVVGKDKTTGEMIFFECSEQTPAGRRSICYDHEALKARKEHKPKNSAVAMARALGAEILTEEDYRKLQTLGAFDTKTQSW